MIIATRTLKLRRKQEEDSEIPIRIYLPEQSGERAWSCKFEIDWPDGTFAVPVGGVDSAQALYLALQMIGSAIYASEYHQSGDLYSEAPGRGYGLPVATTLRDMLVGDDAKYL
jgi:hypothetical protein